MLFQHPTDVGSMCLDLGWVCLGLAVVLYACWLVAKVWRRLRTPDAVKRLREHPATAPVAPTVTLLTPSEAADPWPAAPVPPPRRTLQKPRLADVNVDWPTRQIPAAVTAVTVVAMPELVAPAAAHPKTPAHRGRFLDRFRQRDAHEGAVLGWSPGRDMAKVEADQMMTPIEFLPREPLMEGLAETTEPMVDVIRDDVHHALTSIDVAIAAFNKGADVAVATFGRNIDTALGEFDEHRKTILRTLVAGERTGEISKLEIQALLDAPVLVAA